MNWTSYPDQVEDIATDQNGRRIITTREGKTMQVPGIGNCRVDNCHEFSNIPVTFADVLTNIIVKGLPRRIWTVKDKRNGSASSHSGRRHHFDYWVDDGPYSSWADNNYGSLRTLLLHQFTTGYRVVQTGGTFDTGRVNAGYLSKGTGTPLGTSSHVTYYLPVKNKRIGSQIIEYDGSSVSFQDLVDFVLLGKNNKGFILINL